MNTTVNDTSTMAAPDTPARAGGRCRWRLVGVAAALAMLAGSCGGSDDPADVGPEDLEIDLGDPELNEVIEEALDDIDLSVGDEEGADAPDQRFAGYRIWDHRKVEELLPGGVNNLAPNPIDEFSFTGPTFELELGTPGTSGDVYLPTLVASYDHAWVVAGQGEQLALLDYETNAVGATVDAAELAPEGEIVGLLGDDESIYAVLGLLDEAEIVELDPATGAERRRTTIGSAGGRVTGADMNDEWITLSFSASAINTPLVSRETLEVEDEVENIESKAALLTDTDLAIVEGSGSTSVGDSLRLYSLADRSVGELIEMPGNGTTRTFGDTVVQYDELDGQFHGIAGHGPALESALAATGTDRMVIGDIYIGDDFAIVQGCCADTAEAERQSLFIIDLTSGEILLASAASGTIVPPSAG